MLNGSAFGPDFDSQLRSSGKWPVELEGMASFSGAMSGPTMSTMLGQQSTAAVQATRSDQSDQTILGSTICLEMCGSGVPTYFQLSGRHRSMTEVSKWWTHRGRSGAAHTTLRPRTTSGALIEADTPPEM